VLGGVFSSATVGRRILTAATIPERTWEDVDGACPEPGRVRIRRTREVGSVSTSAASVAGVWAAARRGAGGASRTVAR
jgi:hypothetical protein